jgi:hypothetical protein
LIVEHCCSLMDEYLADGRPAVIYSPAVREYSVQDRDRRSQGVTMLRFCPWCGKELPVSLRDEWFSQLQSLGYDPTPWADDPKFPDEYRSDVWWKGKGL